MDYLISILLIVVIILAIVNIIISFLVRARLEKKINSLYSTFVGLDRNNIKNDEKLDEYRKHLHDEAELKMYSGNRSGVNLVREILDNKQYQASVLGIRIESHISENSFFNEWDNDDIIRLVSNCTNNAIEACGRMLIGRKEIDIFIDSKCFVVSNSKSVFQKKYEVSNRTTSKADSENHGFGTTIIKEIVEKYNGNVNIIESPFKYEITIDF